MTNTRGPNPTSFEILADMARDAADRVLSIFRRPPTPEQLAFDAAAADVLTAFADASPETRRAVVAGFAQGFTADQAATALTRIANAGITLPRSAA